MKCCDKCKDCLKIPKAAILKEDAIKIIQSFPFICRQENACKYNSKQHITHKVICVKEYRNEILSSDTEICQKYPDDYPFQKYVEIIINGNFGDISAFQVRCSSQRTGETDVLKKYESDEHIPCVDDAAYYTISHEQIKIFTKHFSLYFIDYKLENKYDLYASVNSSEDCEALKEIVTSTVNCKSREVDLVADAYFFQTETYSTNNMHTLSLRVYARDKLFESNNTVTCNTENIQYIPLSPSAWPLDNPPEVIRKDTKFQCVAVFQKQMWRESIGGAVSWHLLRYII